ncbi:MAG: hypothetical protein JNL50_01940 [Phycisphaerae bacterium]|nr:hypothetical protein [Phycisphaerae bacterium]
MAGGMNILAAFAILGTVPAAASLIWSWQQRHIRAGGLCRKCDYPLRDLEPRADGRFLCPECGLIQSGRAHASHRVGHLLDGPIATSALVVLGLPLAICAVLALAVKPDAAASAGLGFALVVAGLFTGIEGLGLRAMTLQALGAHAAALAFVTIAPAEVSPLLVLGGSGWGSGLATLWLMRSRRSKRAVGLETRTP